MRSKAVTATAPQSEKSRDCLIPSLSLSLSLTHTQIEINDSARTGITPRHSTSVFPGQAEGKIVRWLERGIKEVCLPQ